MKTRQTKTALQRREYDRRVERRQGYLDRIREINGMDRNERNSHMNYQTFLLTKVRHIERLLGI